MASRRCWTWSTDRFALRALCALHMWLYVYMPRTICGVISTFLAYFHDFLSTCLLCLDVYSFTWSFDFLLGREWTRGLNKQGVGKFSEKQINGGWNKQRGRLFVSFYSSDANISMFSNIRTKLQFMEREKNAEAMWKQIFQIQKYDLVTWKLKWNINLTWEINTSEN